MRRTTAKSSSRPTTEKANTNVPCLLPMMSRVDIDEYYISYHAAPSGCLPASAKFDFVAETHKRYATDLRETIFHGSKRLILPDDLDSSFIEHLFNELFSCQIPGPFWEDDSWTYILGSPDI